eukprot:132589-Prorocentrum_minimum.AAC.1
MPPPLTPLVYAAQLEPPTEVEKWFPADHMFQKFDDATYDRFLASQQDLAAKVKVSESTPHASESTPPA